MKVFVYYNLHKHLWSIKALEGKDKGRVIAHRKELALFRCTPKVSQAGRKRVLKEKRKNVHAGMVGTWYRCNLRHDLDRRGVTYNPYKYESFVYRDDESEYKGSTALHFTGKHVWEVQG
jgi:hypothetical protein